MKDYRKIYAEIQKEQIEYVEKVRNILFDLLESYGVPQRGFAATHEIQSIFDKRPEFGYEFMCNTNGTVFTFTVRIRDNFIETSGFTAGSLPATKIAKRWYSLKRLKREFINTFGACFLKSN